MSLPIRRYMTASPRTIGKDQTLTVAHHMMREGRLRHLPVLDGGKLVGILSLRDLHLIETLRDVDPDTATVEEAMTMDVYVTEPTTPLEQVAATMAEYKYGSAVIVDRGKIAGVFTTVDALFALADILHDPPQARPTLRLAGTKHSG